MGTITAYRCAMTCWYGGLGVLGVLTVIAAFGVVSSINVAERSAGPAILCGIFAWTWHVVLKMPYEVRFNSHDVVFRSISGETYVAFSDIRVIEPALSGGWLIQHERGTVTLSWMFKSELGEIVARIRSANPEV